MVNSDETELVVVSGKMLMKILLVLIILSSTFLIIRRIYPSLAQLILLATIGITAILLVGIFVYFIIMTAIREELKRRHLQEELEKKLKETSKEDYIE